MEVGRPLSWSEVAVDWTAGKCPSLDVADLETRSLHYPSALPRRIFFALLSHMPASRPPNQFPTATIQRPPSSSRQAASFRSRRLFPAKYRMPAHSESRLNPFGVGVGGVRPVCAR